MKTLCLILAITASLSVLGQPLTGNKTIPGDYPSLKLAMADLNAQGVGTGGVVFLVAAGHTEISSHILIRTPTASVSSPVLIQKSGTGPNPLITAEPGSSLGLDGIIVIEGTDYVTIRGLDLVDPLTNSNDTTQMEWGVAILPASETDAPRYVRILQCGISLQMEYQSANYTSAIYSRFHSSASIDTIHPTASEGVASHCLVDSCHISHVTFGVRWFGYTDPAYYGLNNQFGAEGGNDISNFGGAPYYPSGIYTKYQDSVKILNNHISTADGITVRVHGIQTDSAVNASVEIRGNVLNITSNAPASRAYGICNRAGNAGTDNTILISDNLVTVSHPVSNTSEASVHPITNWGSAYNCIIRGNEITGCSIGSDSIVTVAVLQGIYMSGANTMEGSTCYIDSNLIHHNQVFLTDSLNQGFAYGIYVYNAGQVCTIAANQIYQNVWPSRVLSAGIRSYNFSSPLIRITGNQVFDNAKTGTVLNGSVLSGNLYGIYSTSCVQGGVIEYDGNSIHNLSNSWGGDVLGIYNSCSSPGISRMRGNKVFGFETVNKSIWGLATKGAIEMEISGNQVYDFQVGLSGGYRAIDPGGAPYGSDNLVFNNSIWDMRAKSQDVSAGLMTWESDTGSVFHFFHNTVFLNQDDSSSFLLTAAAFWGLNTRIDMRNNILVNESKGGVAAAVVHEQFTPESFLATSNNNCLYAGTPGPDNILFMNYYNMSSGAVMTLDDYLQVFPEQSASFSEKPPFLNTQADPYNLHLDPVQASWCESGGTVITEFEVGFDFDGEPRYPDPACPHNPDPLILPGAPDVGADEFGGLNPLQSVDLQPVSGHDPGFTLYPNPAVTQCQIERNIDADGNPLMVRILNGQGVVVAKEVMDGPRLTMGLDCLQPGIYLVTAENGQTVYTRRLVKLAP